MAEAQDCVAVQAPATQVSVEGRGSRTGSKTACKELVRIPHAVYSESHGLYWKQREGRIGTCIRDQLRECDLQQDVSTTPSMGHKLQRRSSQKSSGGWLKT